MAMTGPSPDSATRARRGKPWTRPRSCLRATAPVLDPTGVHFIVSLVSVLNPAPDCRCQLLQRFVRRFLPLSGTKPRGSTAPSDWPATSAQTAQKLDFGLVKAMD